MSITAVGFGDPTLQALFQQRRQDFKSMLGAVQSGDLQAAQTALAAYQKDVQNRQSQVAQAGPTSGSGGTKIQTDLSTLTAAIQAGNITDAQSALSAYEQDQAASQSPAAAFAADLVKVIQDVGSGDSTAAQADAANLGKDLANLLGAQTTGPVHHHHHHAAVSAASENTADGDQSAGAPTSTSSAATGAGATTQSSASGVTVSSGSSQASSPATASTATGPDTTKWVQDLVALIHDTEANSFSGIQTDTANLAADFKQLLANASQA